MKQLVQSTSDLALEIRREALWMVSMANASHIGGVLSSADIIAVLYGQILRVRPSDPHWPERDRFILSKGHCCAGLYAALAIVGFFPKEELRSYGQNGSRLMAHVSHKVPGIEFSTGSLGHGLPYGCGKALAAKRRGEKWRTIVLLSDGEMDEGSNWEALLFAPHHSLGQLTVVIDYNKIQSLGSVSEVLNLEPLAAKLNAFGWNTIEVDGHNHEELQKALQDSSPCGNKPRAVIAHTIKGKGVDFMENQLRWHYSAPQAQELDSALAQLERLR